MQLMARNDSPKLAWVQACGDRCGAHVSTRILQESNGDLLLGFQQLNAKR
jgi:hypothetical protein